MPTDPVVPAAASAVADGGAGVAPVRKRILAEHDRVVRAVVAAADRVADDWDGDHATDRAAVAEPLAADLADRDLGGSLVAALVDAVDAAGFEVRGDPVPAPPYLAVTGRGPVLRATVDGGRVVVVLAVFAVRRTDRGVRYVRTGSTPEAVVSVEYRGDRA